MYNNKFINVLSDAREDYIILYKDITTLRKDLQNKYKEEYIKSEIEKAKAENEKLFSNTMKKIDTSYNSQMQTLKGEYDKQFTGGAITDDIKLLECELYNITSNEFQRLVERYKALNNFVMLRILWNYADKHKLPFNGMIENKIESKIELLESIYKESSNYIKLEPSSANEEYLSTMFKMWDSKL